MVSPEAAAESNREKTILVSRALVFALRHPKALKSELLSHEGIGDILEWHLPIKTPTSHAANALELPGGKLRPGELPELAAIREVGEEINLRQRSGQPEFICQADYQIPCYNKQTDDGKTDLGFRALFIYGMEMFLLDRPYPIDPDKANIDRVVSLTSSQLIQLLETNQVEIQTEEGSQVLLGIDYFQLIGENSRQALINYIRNKEASIRDQAGGENFDIETLLIQAAKRYLTPFAQRGDAVFVPAMIYATCGLGFTNKPDNFEELINLLPEEEAKRVRHFFEILQNNKAYVDNLSLVNLRDVNQTFTARVERDLRTAGILTGNLSLDDHLDNVRGLIQAVTGALIVKGVLPGADVDLSNETLNQSLCFLYEIFSQGTVYRKEVNDRIFHDAAKILGFLYTFIRLEPDYLAAVAQGDFEISRAMAKNFVLTEDRVQLGPITASVRKYSMPQELEGLIIGSSGMLAVVVDEAPRKDRVSFCRKVLAREDPEKVGDVFRRSLIVVGYYNENDCLILFEKKPDFILDFNILITNQFSERFRKMLMKEYGLVWGDSARRPDIMPDDNLSGSTQEPSIGSVAHRFLWQKFYAFPDTNDQFFSSADSNGGNGEISEVAIWAAIGDHEGRLGYVSKKADDEVFAFWRLAMILGWFHPDTISSPSVSQVVFRRDNR